MPARVAVPSRLSVKVTAPGRLPVLDNVGIGVPDVVTVKLPALPAVKVVLLALVICRLGWTTSVKFWVALGRVPLPAVMVMG